MNNHTEAKRCSCGKEFANTKEASSECKDCHRVNKVEEELKDEKVDTPKFQRKIDTLRKQVEGKVIAFQDTDGTLSHLTLM